MNPERWEEVVRLYNAAMELEPARRAAFLAETCAGDDSLRSKVGDLLKHGDRASSFMEDSALDMVLRGLAEDSTPTERKQVQERPQNEDGRKPRKGAPWWMYAAGAAFLICAAVHYYDYIFAPEHAGITFGYIADKTGLATGVVITAVLPDSPAAKAELRPGDIIFAENADGFIPSNPRWAPLYWRSGRAYHIEFKRNKDTKITTLKLSRNSLHNRLKGRGKENLVLAIVSMLYLILAAIIAFNRPYDPAAKWGGLWLANLAVTASYFPLYPSWLGWSSTLMGLPGMVSWLTMLVLYSTAFNQWVGITFLAVFPRRLFRQPWIWAVIWFPALMLIPVPMVMYPNPMHPFFRWWPDWYDSAWRTLLMFATGALALVGIMNYLRLRDLNERRRIRIVVTGLAISVLAALFFLARLILPTRLDFLGQMSSVMQANFWLVSACLYAVFPICMAYGILRHRLFDIRVMIRLGLRYAVLRGALLSLVPLVGVILAGDLFLHQDQPLREILSQRGLVYAVLAGGGFLLHIRRRVWLDALDRRFFREQYNAQKVLRAVVEEVREMRDFVALAPRVVSQIEAALHPEFAALLMRRPGEVTYQVLAGGEKAPPPIPADSKVINLVHVLGEPVEISEKRMGWLDQLPRNESDFLRRSRIEWLFPICLAEDRDEALLVIGPKRSEEPYSQEDRELLQGITSSLALLLEESPATVGAGFEECPECGACYDSGSGNCSKEDAKLTPQPYPRLLNHRYRFEQRLGEGGMGMVYEAHDTELERRVAVKLIRPELTASAEAAARFRREARAAASFTHPNVVTVHDFGVAEYQRAYLVMELLRGCTLRQELHRSGRLQAQRASKILQGVCTAVAAAHQQLLLHRDLKPGNIFLANSGGVEVAKILDFGVVKPIAAQYTRDSGQTGPGMLMGTLKYMSPEELRGEKPSKSWDIWALTVVAYEMLAGTYPFAGSTALEIRDSIVGGRAIPLRTHLPEAPPAWQHFFDEALATQMKQRPISVLQLLSDFIEAIAPSPAY